MIPFSPPRIDQKIIDEITDTLKSGWITTGPKTRRFEQMLTDYAGNKKTLCVNSATAGLELILRWFGVTAGDEVIVPAYTYAASANVVVHCGARVVFADTGTDFNLSVDSLRRLITPRTKVIIPVDIGGYPCDYDEINALVTSGPVKKMFSPETLEQKTLGRILVLSDAAHSLGAVYHERRTGSLTDITVFSFHAVKNLTTAEGGAVCLNLPAHFDNDAVFAVLNIKALHGQTKDAMEKNSAGNWRYDVVEPGYKFNMTDIQASMGIVELPRYNNDMLVRRKQIFDRYAGLLSACSWAQVPEYESDSKKSSYHAFLLRIHGITEMQRDRIILKIVEKEVSVNVHFVPLPLFTWYKNAGYRMKDFPVSYDNFSREITLPVYYDLTDEKVGTVVQAVASSVKEVLS